MTFLQPWWLLLLPLWPLLLLLVRSRDRRRIRAVPDFLLWERAAARLPPAETRDRLSWRDLLWVLPPALLTLGLAAPGVRRPGEPVAVVVLLDRSASMGTHGPDGTTRLERGLAAARRILGGRPHRVEGIPPAASVDDVSAATVSATELVESAVMTDAAGIPVLVVTDLALPDLPPAIGLVQVSDSARNAGITAAGFDSVEGLLVRVEADAGSGPRTLTVRSGADGATLYSSVLEDPSQVRRVIPPAVLPGSSIVLRLEPADALALDDEVTLVASRRPLRVAVERTAPSIDRALRACPGALVVAGADVAADLVVGARPPRAGAFALLLAPIPGVDGFETGIAAPVEGALSGSGAFAGLTGPSRWRAVFPLVKQPEGTERLLEAGRSPLLVRHGRTFALLAGPEENGWASVPSFPLTIARIVEIAGAATGARLEVGRGAAVLSPFETHVARADPPAPRPPASAAAEPSSVELAAWCHGAALLAILALLSASLRARRRDATPRTRPASGPGAAIRQTTRS